MQVINKHKRIINQPKQRVSELLETLSNKDDKIWPNNNWPAIRFKNGLKVGSIGGHGPIRYKITNYKIGENIYFEFIKPSGFIGFHYFEIKENDADKTEVIHIINMRVFGLSMFYWLFIIRWLHDALIEDALDNIENEFSTKKKITNWSLWVKFLRQVLN